MPYLELEGGAPKVTPVELSGELIVGSGSQAGWRLQNRDLAARHFRLRHSTEGGWTVAPCSAQNVVVLEGTQVAPGGSPLAPGAVIAAGSARFTFLERLDAPRPPAAPTPEPAWLVDGVEGIGYPLQKRVLQIGREIGCAIVLRDPTVSRFHADVRAEGGGFVLYSMGASGTLLNGQVLTAPRMLLPRDQVKIGATTFSFLRGELPTGVREGTFETRDGGAVHRRPTITHGRAVGARAAMGNPRVLAGIAAGVIAGALVLYALL